jgi:hypothetical protein
MKGVPVRRLALPRIPAPPEAARANDEHVPASPPATRTATTATVPAA